MTVYAVTRNTPAGDYIMDIYSSKEEAEKRMKAWNDTLKFSMDRAWIEEYNVLDKYVEKG